MRNIKFTLMLCIFTICAAAVSAQQTIISGKVSNSKSKESVSAVSVTVKGTTSGTYTDDKGEFKLVTTQKLPFTLVFSSVGFADKEVSITDASQSVQVSLDVKYSMGDEIVVAASRVSEKIIESPVSIERMGASAVKNAVAPNFYDAILNFKGVDMTTSSINFRTISTRGFNGSGNLRANQLVDGMDNQAPALNFSVGNIVGMTELDVDNVELLPGASSALYGSGGMNGTILMSSKNPFKYQGLSFQVKQGINHVDSKQTTAAPYFDWAFRWGKKVTERFAFKISGQFIQAQDWQAVDYANLARNNVYSQITNGDRITDPNYDGVNVYGDEVGANMQYLARLGLLASGIAPNSAAYTGLNSVAGMGLNYAQSVAFIQNNVPALVPALAAFPTVFSINRGYYASNISRTGYNEKDLVDYNSYNVKLSGGLYYKLKNNVEASVVGYWGQATSVYTGIDRYSLKNLKMGQYKAELKAKNWFLRGYLISENSGDSYANTITAVQMNRMWKADATWFSQYMTAYTQTMLGTNGNATLAHAQGRAAADQGRYMPGSTGFMNAFEQVTGTSITNGGGLFADKSKLYHFEGQYNLTDKIKVAEVLVGASYRVFNLNSGGTIFADHTPNFKNGNINISEVGGYVQVAKRVNDFLKLTGSIRYDKNQNFDGRFTPRATALFKVAKDNNIRVSFQTAYRFPSTQDQWINLNSPSAKLIGALPIFNDVYGFSTNPIYTAESVGLFRAKFAATGAIDPTVLVKGTFQAVKPETVKSYEIGYRGVIKNKLMIDAYFYFSEYNNFLGRVAVARGQNGTQMELLNPSSSNNYSFVTNTASNVKAIGWGISADYMLPKGFVFNANVSGDQLNDVPSTVFTQFNTPKMRFNIGLSNTNVYKNWGFGIVHRWQDKVNWEGTFGTGVIPSYGTWDAMVSYKTANKGLFKIGALNFWNKYYRSAFGNPQVGGVYYISYGYNL